MSNHQDKSDENAALAETIGLPDILAAQERIKPYIRRTPLSRAQPVKDAAVPRGVELYLKLENMQITGSFKARGAVSKLYTLSPEILTRGIVTASGGNHGLGVAYAGWLAGITATIYLPHNTPPSKIAKLTAWGAKIIMAGKDWDEANEAALAETARENLTYFHPFSDPFVIAGQGTIGLEILEDIPDIDTILISIGGGGLISGISIAIKALFPHAKIIGIEPTGAPTLFESLKVNHPVALDEIRTRAGSLAPRLSTALNLAFVKQNVDEIILVTDDEMNKAAHWLWFECGVAAELSGAATLAALLSGKVCPRPGEKVCAIVCGAGTDGLI